MSTWLTRCIAAAAVGFVCSGTILAQNGLSPDQLRQAAVIALKEDDPAVARQFASALVQRDPSDLNAHLILARASRDLGEVAPARVAARTAWQLAETDAERYSTALITAQILATDGKRTRAQLWLRRAVQNAPNDALRERATRDFQYVKQQNPWKTDLTFTFAPNSNINNGSARDRSRLNYAISELLFGEEIEFDLDDEAQAISGIEIGGSVRTRYRFHQTPTTAHDVNLSLSYRTFEITDTLSDETVKGSDFAFGNVALGYGYRRLNMDRKGEFSLNVEAGQSWYGGSRYASYARTQLQQAVRINQKQRLRFGADLERQWGQATPDVDSLGLSVSLTQAFASGNSGLFGISAVTTQSPNEGSEYAELTLRTGLALKKPVMGAALQIAVGASWRDYDFSRDSRDGRQDVRLFADVTATFKDIDYYGFNPTVRLSASTTDSNIGLFDVNRVGLNIGIKSAF
ncbi:MAG: surface lipoprotein assembly modifier [Sulfitobacter sp.]